MGGAGALELVGAVIARRATFGDAEGAKLGLHAASCGRSGLGRKLEGEGCGRTSEKRAKEEDPGEGLPAP